MTAVRDFAPGDQSAVRALIQAGLQERWGAEFDPNHNPDLDDLTASYLDQGGEIVVIEADGEVIATGTLIPDGTDRARIVRMSVDHRHRGQGLGRQVVDELLRRARRRPVAEVLVSTDTPWTSALALYRACGFTETGHDETDTHFTITL